MNGMSLVLGSFTGDAASFFDNGLSSDSALLLSEFFRLAFRFERLPFLVVAFDVDSLAGGTNGISSSSVWTVVSGFLKAAWALRVNRTAVLKKRNN